VSPQQERDCRIDVQQIDHTLTKYQRLIDGRQCKHIQQVVHVPSGISMLLRAEFGCAANVAECSVQARESPNDRHVTESERLYVIVSKRVTQHATFRPLHVRPRFRSFSNRFISFPDGRAEGVESLYQFGPAEDLILSPRYKSNFGCDLAGIRVVRSKGDARPFAHIECSATVLAEKLLPNVGGARVLQPVGGEILTTVQVTLNRPTCEEGTVSDSMSTALILEGAKLILKDGWDLSKRAVSKLFKNDAAPTIHRGDVEIALEEIETDPAKTLASQAAAAMTAGQQHTLKTALKRYESKTELRNNYQLELDGGGGNPIEQGKLRTQIGALDREMAGLLNEIASLLESLGISTRQNGVDGTELTKVS